MAFGGTEELTGEAESSEEPIWKSSRDGETYPHRFPVRLETAVEPGRYVPAADLVQQMQFTRKWPAEHRRLAFQGNVHRLPAEDYGLIRRTIEERRAR